MSVSPASRIALVDGSVDRGDPVLLGAQVEILGLGRGCAAAPLSWHATACAALLVGQPGRETCGIVPDAVLVSVPVLGLRADRRSVRDRMIAYGIEAATATGVDVMVLPFGRTEGSAVISKALDSAVQQGVVLFAAAGNLGPDTLTFPGSHPRVRSVTARGLAGPLPECCARADIIAFGEDIDICGPGELPGGRRLRGTSPAAVIAAGEYLRDLRRDRALLADRLASKCQLA